MLGRRPGSKLVNAWVGGAFAASLVACTEQVSAPQAPPRSADAIVVGAGLSGLAAAVEMGRAGVNVVLLDMNSVMGGHAVMAGGFAIVDTPIQREAGFDDSAEKAYADWMQWTGDGDPGWTRYYAENSREMIHDWMAEMGVQFVRVQAGHENSVPRFHFTPRGALDVVLALYREALELPGVVFEWNEKVHTLVVEEGRVTGVNTRNLRTGVERTLHAPHVVLATGGFEGNLERVLEYWRTDLPRPDRLLLGASIHATGTGHDLAEEAGAGLTWMNRHYIYTNGMVDPRDPDKTLAITAGNNAALWVNAQGRRFTNRNGFRQDHPGGCSRPGADDLLGDFRRIVKGKRFPCGAASGSTTPARAMPCSTIPRRRSGRTRWSSWPR